MFELSHVHRTKELRVVFGKSTIITGMYLGVAIVSLAMISFVWGTFVLIGVGLLALFAVARLRTLITRRPAIQA